MSDEALDARELVRRVRASKRTEQWSPLLPEDPAALRSPMRRDPRLTALANSWILPDHLEPQHAGAGLRRFILRPFGRLVYRVMSPYLRAERELLAQLVQANDALAERCDELAQTIARRQAGEAENLTKLAAWLHDELSHPSDDGSRLPDQS